MLSHLKVKHCTLGAESKIIKNQMRKWKARAASARAREKDASFAEANYTSQYFHLKEVVRREARLTHLAYGFLRGRSYYEMERLAYIQPDWDKIESMIMRFSEDDPRDLAQRFSAWKAEALHGCTVEKQWLNAAVGSVKRVTAWSSKAWEEQKARTAEYLVAKAAKRAARPDARNRRTALAETAS